MNNETPKASGRQRLPYGLNPTVTALRDWARSNSVDLEELVSEMVAAIEDDGVIDEREFRRLFPKAVRALVRSKDAQGVLNLLDESGTEPALREVEQVQRAKTK